jgi:hypothetical protein
VYDPNYLAVRYFGGFIPWLFTDVVISRETDGNRLAGYRRDARSDAQSTPTFRYFPTTGGSITYNKTALWLNTLERWLGWPTVQRIMATHFERWKFGHPRPEDFFGTASEVAGRDLTGFFDQVHRSSNVFDYGVQSLVSARDGARYRTNVVVRRYGEAIFPVDVLVTFGSGEQVTEHWAGEERWKRYTYDRTSRAVSAQVDPDSKQRSHLVLRGAIVERSRDLGVFVSGSDALIESSVIRDTAPGSGRPKCTGCSDCEANPIPPCTSRIMRRPRRYCRITVTSESCDRWTAWLR